MRYLLTLLLAILGGLVCNLQTASAADKLETLVVHEWGTFTELQDATGASIGGINTDDEPVPEFVHRISPYILQSPIEPWRSKKRLFSIGKGLPRNPRVLTRLETPVIYFYPPAGRKRPLRVDVDVQLRGGWLSEFYPQALAHAPGLSGQGLNRDAVGTLQWKGLKLGGEGELPETEDHVWLAPRIEGPALITTPTGESERYLFYRGVGNFSGPLRVSTTSTQNRLRLESRFHTLDADSPIAIPAAWLVSIQPDNSLAFRSLGAMSASPEVAQSIAEVSRRFESAEFSAANRARLQEEMHRALVQEGLYENEATAMLSTWQRAYFRTEGLRLFYLLPREWTDDRMPLTLSVAAEVKRVMMGRVELITDRQRALLAELSRSQNISAEWIGNIPNSAARTRFYAGEESAVGELGIEVPESYQAYLGLGRFRNALVHHELANTGNENLATFISQYGLLTSGF